MKKNLLSPKKQKGPEFHIFNIIHTCTPYKPTRKVRKMKQEKNKSG